MLTCRRSCRVLKLLCPCGMGSSNSSLKFSKSEVFREGRGDLASQASKVSKSFELVNLYEMIVNIPTATSGILATTSLKLFSD